MKTTKTKQTTKEFVISDEEKLKLIVELSRLGLIVELSKKYPNDQELGREVRKLISSFLEK